MVEDVTMPVGCNKRYDDPDSPTPSEMNDIIKTGGPDDTNRNEGETAGEGHCPPINDSSMAMLCLLTVILIGRPRSGVRNV